MTSSWQRPMLLSGQILRFMNQTYDNYTMSVSIKGTEPEWIEKTFMQEWQPFIDQAKLIIRYDVNRDQLSNQLDPVRDLDIEQYDYFCKVDDDDWYAPTYLEEVNEWLNKEENIDLSASSNMTELNNGDIFVNMSYSQMGWSGNTLCFSRKALKTILAVEKNPHILEPIYSAKKIAEMRNSNEDALILDLIMYTDGKIQKRHTPQENVIYGRQYQSLTRHDKPCTIKKALFNFLK
ncbi:MAG: hypothetical protein IJ852_04020 [Alphaproteobacteria bacterium]|nr:hypothetical protein [Alphaproteobacteria bacterium]